MSDQVTITTNELTDEVTVTVSNDVGPAGPTGPAGADGAAGPTGATGPAGPMFALSKIFLYS